MACIEEQTDGMGCWAAEHWEVDNGRAAALRGVGSLRSASGIDCSGQVEGEGMR